MDDYELMPLTDAVEGLNPEQAQAFTLGVEYSAFLDIARDREVTRFHFQVHPENLDRILRLLRANGWNTKCSIPRDGWSWLEGWRVRHGV